MNRKSKHVALIAALSLAGCVTVPTTPPGPIAATPTCSGDADCAVKWAVARTFVLDHAGYKLQTYSPDFMETYSPGDVDGRLAAQVNKEPQPGGGYAIVAKFYCHAFRCRPDAHAALDHFNEEVAAAGAPAVAAH